MTCSKRVWLDLKPNTSDLTWLALGCDLTWLDSRIGCDLTCNSQHWLGTCYQWLGTWLGLAQNDLLTSLQIAHGPGKCWLTSISDVWNDWKNKFGPWKNWGLLNFSYFGAQMVLEILNLFWPLHMPSAFPFLLLYLLSKFIHL